MPPRRGYSLIELLMVLAIISVLIALLLPAVLSAREAARRTQCTNNLKQIGLALNNYHDAMNCFPPGWISIPDPATGEDTGPGWGWVSMMLPSVEQYALFNQINFSLPIEALENESSCTRTLSTFWCPSDAPFARTFPVFDGGTTGGTSGDWICDVPSSSYVGCFGKGDPSSLYPYNPTDALPGRDNGEGLFFRNRAIPIAAIADGTSQTLAIGERSQNVSRSTWAGVVTGAALPITEPQGGGGPSPAGGDALVVSSAGDRGGPNAIPPRADGFSSGHPGGAHFLFADGSVRFMKERRPAEIFQALTTRAGGEMISEDEF